MKNNKFQYLIPALLLVLFSCKDEDVVPEPPEPLEPTCYDVLDGWNITSDDFPMVQKQNDLFFPEDQIGYSVGNRGTILKTSNGGQDWQILEFYYLTELGLNENLLTKANLNTVYFINELIGFAGGDGEYDFSHNRTDAVYLKTGDGGNNWRKIYLKGVKEIYDLIFFDRDHGIGLFDSPNSGNRIMITNDGGENWSEVVMPVPNIVSYQIILTPSRIIVLTNDNSYHPILCSTNDKGLNWETQSIPKGPCGNIYFLNDEIGFADCKTMISPTAVYQTKDGGNSWEEAEVPLNHFSLLHFNSPEEGFIINPVYDEVEHPMETYVVLRSYEVFQTVDGGKVWSKNEISKECNFTGIKYSTSNNLLYSLRSGTVTRFEKK